MAIGRSDRIAAAMPDTYDTASYGTATGAYLIIAPIKLEGGSGGQVGIFAIVPPETQ